MDDLPSHKWLGYSASKPAQAGKQSKATGDRIQLEAQVKDIATDRLNLQRAADTIWPASDKANAAIRREFGLPPSRSLK